MLFTYLKSPQCCCAALDIDEGLESPQKRPRRADTEIKPSKIGETAKYLHTSYATNMKCPGQF